MAVDEGEGVEALCQLGLSSYEAKVFIALQALGQGTARDVDRISDVPRSQVYGAADSLADRGLIEVKHSTPIEYRPVDLEKAQTILSERFERDRERAFEHLERVRERDRSDEEREDIWSIRGGEPVTDRIVDLVQSAEQDILFGAKRPDLVGDRIERVLVERANVGVSVVLISEDPTVLEPFEDFEGIECYVPPDAIRNERSGRVLVADGRSVLLSVITGEEEMAIYSAETGFATVLATILLDWFGTVVKG